MTYAVGIAALGITGFAAALSGHLLRPLDWRFRALAALSAALLLFPGKASGMLPIPLHDAAGMAVFAGLVLLNLRKPA
jgi:TRAP-type uncharacterized transport system fused permease subunit